MKRLIAGNWKMNLLSAQANDLVSMIKPACSELKRSDVIVFPQFPLLPGVLNGLKGSMVEAGAQNASQHSSGAYTGEVSPDLIADLGCSTILIGHSERRDIYHESDEICAAKLSKFVDMGLKTIYCIGESLELRESDKYKEHLSRQLDYLVKVLDDKDTFSVDIAYEPIWAIGTGKTATTGQAVEIAIFIRDFLSSAHPDKYKSVRVLYGGSVNAANAGELLGSGEIMGLLIGGASLKEDFVKIIEISERI